MSTGSGSAWHTNLPDRQNLNGKEPGGGQEEKQRPKVKESKVQLDNLTLEPELPQRMGCAARIILPWELFHQGDF